MGIAIILNSANFASKNLGKVTIVQDVEVESMGIIAEDSYEGMTAQLTASYNPASTNQKGCTWSIVEGGSYASIDNNGLLTIKSGANNSSVKVRATNTYNSNVYAEKTISVTYNDAADYLTSISISNGAAENNTIQFAVAYNPDNTMYKGVTWSIESGSEYAEIDGNGLLSIKSGASNSAVVVKATSTHDSLISDSKSINVSYVSRPIQFADPAVKAIMVNKFDTDGDGEISTSEADAVTTLNYGSNYLFYQNTEIQTFDELGDFKNLKELTPYYNAGIFTKCTNLSSINLDNIENVGNFAFNQCSSLDGTNGTNIMKLPNVVSIGERAFSEIKCRKFDIGEKLTSIGVMGLSLCANNNQNRTATFVFRGETPPTTINAQAFAYSSPGLLTIDLYAPDASLDAYRTAFANVNAISKITFKPLSEYVEG